MARLAVRAPLLVIVGWVVLVGSLMYFGRGAEEKLLPTTLYLKGTDSGRWLDDSKGHFGENVAVLLTGPADELSKQGPALARALGARPHTRALSPWAGRADSAEARTMRPSPTEAVIVLDYELQHEETVSTFIEPLEEFIDEHIEEPVTAHLSGIDVIGKAQNEQLIESLHHAEMLAFPILIVVLFLVLRTPIAAFLPLFMGISTVQAGFGILSLIADFKDLDAIALSMASMIGLALGVDYSLLIVSRFREALEEGLNVKQATTMAANTAGRTANFAGCVLLSIMVVTLLFAPGSIMFSSAIGAMIVTVLSMVGAMVVTPAVLRLAGHRVNSLWLGPKPKPAHEEHVGVIKRFTDHLARRPLAAMLVVGGLLALLAAPVLSLSMIPPDPRQLPEDDPTLVNFNLMRAAGFGPEVAITVHTATGTLMDPDKISRLTKLEDRLRKVPYVKFVAGPAYLGRETKPIRDAPKAIAKAKRQVKDAKRELDYRSSQLHEANRRIASERAFADKGIAAARDLLKTGSTLLSGADGQLGQLDTLILGLSAARSGAVQLSDGTKLLQDKTGQLTDALRQVRERVKGLLPRIERGSEDLRDAQASLELLRLPAQVTQRGLERAYAGLNGMTVGKTDPQFVSVFANVVAALGAASGRDPVTGIQPFKNYNGLEATLGQAAAQASAAGDEIDVAVGRAGQGLDVLIQLADGSGRIKDPGLRTLRLGIDELAKGLKLARDRIAEAAPAIKKQLADASALFGTAKGLTTDGIARATQGFKDLEAGLGEATTRIDGLRSNLHNRTGPFEGLRNLELLEKKAPNLFKSGYLALGALAGAPPLAARTATLLVDSRTGGNVGRVVILPDVPANDPRTNEVIDRIRDVARDFEKESGMTAPVGGAAGQLVDYNRVLQGRIPILIFAICFVTYLMLVPILRSLVLPAIAIALNMITVGGGFGILCLLFVDSPFNGGHLPFGGSGSLDVIAVAGIFAITFALSIDYQVFLLTRMREEYVRTQDNEMAVDFGITKTAKIVTGAALIMIAVFSAFGLAEFITIKQFGIGLAACVIIDATIVRLALMPNVMRVFGDSTWWMPNWLDERLPMLDVEGAEFEHDTEFLSAAGRHA